MQLCSWSPQGWIKRMSDNNRVELTGFCGCGKGDYDIHGERYEYHIS
jgi:hypothetical protein